MVYLLVQLKINIDSSIIDNNKHLFDYLADKTVYEGIHFISRSRIIYTINF